MDWLLHTSSGFGVRLAIGAAIFAWIAIADFRRHGRAATRWREYAFLFACAGVAMLYGAANDLISSTISWEYFYYGKDLSAVLGPAIPPAAGALYWQAAKVGIAATWSVGLLIGAVMLVANNPSRSREQLRYGQLFRLLPIVIGMAILFSVIGGFIGSVGGLNFASADFQQMWAENTFRPPHFMAAWGIHLGGYIGGAVGAGVSVVLIRRRRLRRDPTARTMSS